eukprot:a339306_516.p2 GENE.a339306_516~~a339306_516.p2  ORF type:complete len:346 (-),score=129.74 a339306_516:14-991(-)
MAAVACCAVGKVVEHPSFDDWAAAHGKVYASKAHRALAMENYEASKARADELNALETTATFGMTEFADMTPEEFKAVYTMKSFAPPPLNPSRLRRPLYASAAPLNFTWNDADPPVVTKVKKQKSCGGCYAFAATEGVESAWARAGNELVELAPQAIISCDADDGGCHGGDSETALVWVIENGGMPLESEYPFEDKTGTCNKTAIAHVAAEIDGYFNPTLNRSESDMAQALYENSPLIICLSTSTEWQLYTGGVFPERLCHGSMDHCVDLTGYNLISNGNDTLPYWVLRNSWGDKWGIGGYMWIQYGVNACKLAEFPSIPIVPSHP